MPKMRWWDRCHWSWVLRATCRHCELTVSQTENEGNCLILSRCGSWLGWFQIWGVITMLTVVRIESWISAGFLNKSSDAFVVLPESRVRSVMAWGGSPRSRLPLPGPICLNCLLSYCNPPLRWETDWRQAAATTLPLPHRLSPSTLHPLKHGTPPNPNDRPTSYR